MWKLLRLLPYCCLEKLVFVCVYANVFTCECVPSDACVRLDDAQDI